MKRNIGKTIEWERLEISSKKIRDTKGTFHTKMGTIKHKNDKDLTEAEDIKKRWQENTAELHKKDLQWLQGLEAALQLWSTGFSLWWLLLLQSVGSRVPGLQ